MAALPISVIVPVYNCEPYIAETIQSILDQTFPEFEFIVVDDGSTDNSWEVINSFTDPRVIKLKNPENKGKPWTLNRALEMARGKYYATMDGDDLAEPTRLAKQFQYMEAHPNCMMVSAYNRYFGPGAKKRFGNKEILTVPTDPDETRVRFLFHSCHSHNNNLVRMSFLQATGIRYIPTDPSGIEDFSFWARFSLAGGEIHTIPEVLAHYRIHDSNITTRRKTLLEQEKKRVIREQLAQMALYPTEDELRCHGCLLHLNVAKTPGTQWPDVVRWAEKLKTANSQQPIVPQYKLEEFLQQQLAILEPKYREYETQLNWRDKIFIFRKRLFA